MNAPLTSLLFLVFAAFEAVADTARSPSYVPADLVNSTRPLSLFITHPRTEGTRSRFVRCNTYINKSGRYSRTDCLYKGAEAHIYAKAVAKKLGKARATPAYVDGEKVRVWLQFAVLFGSDGKEVLVVPNHEPDVTAFGTNYQAPQRYDRLKSCGNSKYSVFLKYTVSAAGEVVHATGFSKNENSKQIDRFRTCVMQARYIPARMNSQPVEATVEEELYPSSGLSGGKELLDEFFRDPGQSRLPL